MITAKIVQDTSIRQTPSLNAKIIGSLKVGETIEVEKTIDETQKAGIIYAKMKDKNKFFIVQRGEMVFAKITDTGYNRESVKEEKAHQPAFGEGRRSKRNSFFNSVQEKEQE